MVSQDVRHPSLLQPYQARAALPGTSPLSAYLLRLMAAKKTNLCVSADVSTTRELLQLAEEVGDHICLLKTHADIIHDFGSKTVYDLQEVAKRKGFLIFEDRKFGDIGNTVQLQYTAGPLQIARWANIVNAHIFPGPAIVTALAQAAENAIAAYTVSVETQISGPPVVPRDPDEQESLTEESLIPPQEPVEELDGDRLSSEGDDDDDQSVGEPVTYSDDDQIGDLATTPQRPRRRTSPCSPSDFQRKLSVVSVSTTISTKTEHISPQATPIHTIYHMRSASDHLQGPTALRDLGDPPMVRGLLLLAQMSSAGNLMDDAYAAKCLEAARGAPDFVIGFIAQRCMNENEGDNFLTMTPGVQIGSKGDGLGQQYNTPEVVVGDGGTDVVIVGRGVYGAADRKAAAAEYRERSWAAYEARIARTDGARAIV